MLPWFRFWNEALDDPKIQGLPGDDFKGWVNSLCVASRNSPRGQLPPIPLLAFSLRVSPEEAEALCARLIDRDLIDQQDGRLLMHGWARRQYESDLSTPRVRRFREKGTKPRKRSRNVSETSSDTDTDTEQKQSRARTEKRSHSLAFAGALLSITEKQDASLAEGFPWVDRQVEYRKMDAWLEANQDRRPKLQGKFAYNWISKISPSSKKGNGAHYANKDQQRLENNLWAAKEALRRMSERDREAPDRDRPGGGRGADS